MALRLAWLISEMQIPKRPGLCTGRAYSSGWFPVSLLRLIFMALILKLQSQEPRQRLALVSAVSMLWAEVKTSAILSCDFHVVFYSRFLSDP